MILPETKFWCAVRRDTQVTWRHTRFCFNMNFGRKVAGPFYGLGAKFSCHIPPHYRTLPPDLVSRVEPNERVGRFTSTVLARPVHFPGRSGRRAGQICNAGTWRI